jgi:uncharacterized protein (DUF433 family)
MATETRTEHPHIVRVEGVAGGQPVIAGTRISVAFLARLLRAGDQPADIIATYPHLEPAAVYDALSYYLDHRDEIDGYIGETAPDRMPERHGFTLDSQGRVRFDAARPTTTSG